MTRPIILTNHDKQRLEDLLEQVAVSDLRSRGDLNSLVEELRRATVVEPQDVPADVITMNSRADVQDLESGEIESFTLVFPAEANIEEGRISVLAPMGAGMLGYRVGDEYEWKVPAGVRRMKGVKVRYQPEAAGDFNR